MVSQPGDLALHGWFNRGRFRIAIALIQSTYSPSQFETSRPSDGIVAAWCSSFFSFRLFPRTLQSDSDPHEFVMRLSRMGKETRSVIMTKSAVEWIKTPMRTQCSLSHHVWRVIILNLIHYCPSADCILEQCSVKLVIILDWITIVRGILNGHSLRESMRNEEADSASHIEKRLPLSVRVFGTSSEIGDEWEEGECVIPSSILRVRPRSLLCTRSFFRSFFLCSPRLRWCEGEMGGEILSPEF